MVTPENGTLILRGVSGKEYSISLYSSDVVGAFVTMELNGLAVAGSTNFYIIPEPCAIVDISVTTGQTVAKAWVVRINDVNVGSVIPFVPILDTLATRSFPRLRIQGGRKFALVQA